MPFHTIHFWEQFSLTNLATYWHKRGRVWTELAKLRKANVTNQSGIIITYDHLIGLEFIHLSFVARHSLCFCLCSLRSQFGKWVCCTAASAPQIHPTATTNNNKQPATTTTTTDNYLARTLISFIAPHISQSRKTIYAAKQRPVPRIRLCSSPFGPLWDSVGTFWSWNQPFTVVLYAASCNSFGNALLWASLAHLFCVFARKLIAENNLSD